MYSRMLRLLWRRKAIFPKKKNNKQTPFTKQWTKAARIKENKSEQNKKKKWKGRASSIHNKQTTKIIDICLWLIIC